MRLSPEQLRSFARDGYVKVSGVLDPHRVEEALDWIWRLAPPDLRRDDPTTYRGRFRAEDKSGWPEYRDDTIWMCWGYQDETLLRLLPWHPPVRSIAEQLLGGGCLDADPRRCGTGIHCTRPETGVLPWPRQCHVDKHPHQLRVVAYLSDVGPQGGATAVWPGSHLAFFRVFRNRYLFEPTEAYDPMILDYDRMTPFDCQGRIGDVLFCHHRLVHKAGHNETGTLRFAALANLSRTDIFDRMDRPPGDDPWEDWSAELRAAM
jgi:hypothetical protein